MFPERDEHKIPSNFSRCVTLGAKCVFAISNLCGTLLNKECNKSAIPVGSIGFNYSVASGAQNLFEGIRLDVANLHSPY